MHIEVQSIAVARLALRGVCMDFEIFAVSQMDSGSAEKTKVRINRVKPDRKDKARFLFRCAAPMVFSRG